MTATGTVSAAGSGVERCACLLSACLLLGALPVTGAVTAREAAPRSAPQEEGPPRVEPGGRRQPQEHQAHEGQEEQQEQQEEERQQEPPPRVEELVTVTATRIPLDRDELTSSTRTVSGDELVARPALGLDEALDSLAALSLFRRTPARSAHPTTHGVNVRGVAPSGTARALVLLDGVPMTDAFGGWVQWDRVPASALEQADLSLGGGPAPYGNQALAGTLQLTTRRPGSRPRGWLRSLGGSDATWSTEAGIGAGIGELEGLLTGRAAGSDGYIGVSPADRGPIDRRLSYRGAGGFAKLTGPGGWRLTADGFAAGRDNGTPVQGNVVRGWGGSLAWDSSPLDPGSGFAVAVFGRRSELDSDFSSVGSERASEVAVLEQRVRSTDLGATLSGRREAGDRSGIAFGADWRRVAGVSRERVLLAGFERGPGGTQHVAGAWGSGRLEAGRVTLEGSLRGDFWHNRSRLQPEQTRDGGTVSPRLGLLLAPSPEWRIRASGYGSFRAPTLNELYRQFRVGNVITAANDRLREERLWGAEAGIVWTGPAAGPLRIELHAFWNRLDDPVTNATVAIGEELVFRQRRNLGAARVVGVELAGELRSGPVQLGLRGLAMDAEILEAAAGPGPDTAGNRLPQVPRWRVAAEALYRGDGWRALLALRATGLQYEDDLGQSPLAAGATVDALVDWQVFGDVRVGLQAQNLFGDRIEVARTPVLVVGPPRTVAVILSVR